MTRDFFRSGHTPTLVAAFLYFDVSFMVWVILGPLGIFIAKDLHLTPAQKGLMVATPVLAGAAFRILNGFLSDTLKPRLTGIIMQSAVILGLVAAWMIGIDSFPQILTLGLVLGIAGASFAIALPLASYWYPARHQGTALGIAGAGNSGTVLAALFAPTLALWFGWRNVLGLAAIPLAIVLVAFLILAKDSPNSPPRRTLKNYADILAMPDCWWLMAFYCVSFGGFVGLSSFLPIYFNDQYGLAPVHAGLRYGSLRVRGFVPAPARRLLERPHRRGEDPVDGLWAGRCIAARHQPRTAESDLCVAADRGDDGRARGGQRRGVPDRAAALSAQMSAS